ncbi:hypothetical protein LMT13_27400, partial [Escherichia coli]
KVIERRLVSGSDKWTYLDNEGHTYSNGYVDIKVEYAVSYRRSGSVTFNFSGGFRSLATSPFVSSEEKYELPFLWMMANATGKTPVSIRVKYNYNGSSKIYAESVSASFYFVMGDGILKHIKMCDMHDVINEVTDKNVLVKDLNNFYTPGDYYVSRPLCIFNAAHPLGEYLIANSDIANNRFEVARVQNEVLTSCKSGDKFTEEEMGVLEMMGYKCSLWVDEVFNDCIYGQDIYPLKKYTDTSLIYARV